MGEKEVLENKIKDLFFSDELKNIRKAIPLLTRNTGRGLAFDPFVAPDHLVWNDLWGDRASQNRFLEALTVSQKQLLCYLRLQEEVGERIHKGTPYHWLGRTYLRLNNRRNARKHFLFAFVENVITETHYKKGLISIKIRNPFDHPAAIFLKLTFRMRDEELMSLYCFASKLIKNEPEKKWFHPEEIILKWRNHLEKQKNLIVARDIEEALFNINRFYIKELYSRAKNDPDPRGENKEELANYLFSCVDGFEPVPKKTTDAFHFDLLIRNLTEKHPLLSLFGEYIGIEAKNINEPVGAEALDHFIHKLRLHSMRCGIIFANIGISGVSFKGDDKYGKSILQKTFNRDNLIVFDITNSDIERIIKGENLISILLAKYEDIRYK